MYGLSQQGELACFDAASGKETWRKDLVKDFSGTLPPRGYAKPLPVGGDKPLVTPGGEKGTVLALDKKSGAVLWQSKELTDPANYSSLVPLDYAGARQYVQLTPASEAAVSAADGKVLWRAASRQSHFAHYA